MTYKEFYDSDTNELYKHYYTLSGTQIVKEDVSYVDWYGEEGEYTLVYIYDENGSPIGFKYREPSYAENVYDCYFFEKNLQGDVVALYNASGTKIATYTYDAWGNFSISVASSATTAERSMAYRNPFRYRGYYYDTNLGMYYLQSRFYNPEWGRFLSADSYDVVTITPLALTDKNLFSYCDNNPIARIDNGGEFWNVLVGALVGGVIAAVGEVVSGKGINDLDFWTSVAIGMAEGALVACFPAASIAISSGASALDTAIDGIIANDDVGTIVISTGVSAFFGAVLGDGDVKFVKGGIMNDAVNSLGDVFGRGVTKKAHRQAVNTIKKAGKLIGESLGEGLFDDLRYGALEKGTSWLYNKVAKRCFGW